MSGWWVWGLLLTPVLLRWLPLPRWGGCGPRTQVGVGLAMGALLAVLFTVLTVTLLAPSHLAGGPVTTSDFIEHCGGVGLLRDGGAGVWPRARSRLPAVIVAGLARGVGVLDAFSVIAVFSVFVIGASLYAWGWLLGGRRAGVATVLWGAAMPPVTILARTLSFYPMIIAGLVLAATLVTAAMLSRSARSLAVAAVAVAALPLLAPRAIVWAAVYLLLLGVTALLAPRRRWPPRLALVVVPLALSWGAGRLVYDADALSLGEQVLHTVDEEPAGVRALASGGAARGSAGFIWGWSGPDGVRTTVARLAGELAGPGGVARTRESPHAVSAVQAHGWVPPVVFALVFVGLALRRDRSRLLVLLGTSAPFLLVWIVALRGGLLEPRWLAQGMVGVAPVLGLAVGRLSTTGGDDAHADIVAPAALGVLLLGLILARVSLTGDAQRVVARVEPIEVLLGDAASTRSFSRLRGVCVGALRRDEVPQGRIYPVGGR